MEQSVSSVRKRHIETFSFGQEVTVPDKKEVRRLALRQRDAVPQEDHTAWSWEIQNKVRDSLWYKKAAVILS